MNNKVVDNFRVKKKLFGGYKVAYKCPHCDAELSSQESEITDEEQCPECGMSFYISDSAASRIQLLRAKNTKRELNLPKGKRCSKNLGSILDAKFKSHAPSDNIRIVSIKADEYHITTEMEILETGFYFIAAGRVNPIGPSGYHSFRKGDMQTKKITGSKGDFITVVLPNISGEEDCTVGAFLSYKDVEDNIIPFLSRSPQMLNPNSTSTVHSLISKFDSFFYSDKGTILLCVFMVIVFLGVFSMPYYLGPVDSPDKRTHEMKSNEDFVRRKFQANGLDFDDAEIRKITRTIEKASKESGR